MPLNEPVPTALLLATFGLLMAFSVLFSRTAERLGVPVVLIFLILGMLAGSDGIGGVAFDNYYFAFRVGSMALVLILFDGGLNTPVRVLRQGLMPASVLATIGVAGTAGLVALCARAVGFDDWRHALLLGAVVSSTDAAAVFAVLRGSRLNLQRRVGVTLELESGINDPMAIILTMTLTEAIVRDQPLGWGVLWDVPLQLAIGAGMGIAIGVGGTVILRRLRLRAGGLFPVLTLAFALLAFGVTTLLHGSGFLAVFVAAVVMGNGDIPYRSGLTRIHDAIAWLGQITMFLMLGLLVNPSELVDVAWAGLGIALFLAFVARPLVVGACLLPFGYPVREVGYIGWVGLRGAVPIILATFPVMAHVPESHRLFNMVFFVVVVNAIIPGATLRWITRAMALEVAEPPPPAAVLEINSTKVLRGDILAFYVDETLAVSNVPLSKINFPQDAAVILVVRGDELIAPRGNTRFLPGDHVYVFCRPEDRPFIQLLFGQAQE